MNKDSQLIFEAYQRNKNLFPVGTICEYKTHEKSLPLDSETSTLLSSIFGNDIHPPTKGKGIVVERTKNLVIIELFNTATKNKPSVLIYLPIELAIKELLSVSFYSDYIPNPETLKRIHDE
jgi:hypothetical protein